MNLQPLICINIVCSDATNANVYAKNIRMMNGYYMFDVQVNDQPIDDVALRYEEA